MRNIAIELFFRLICTEQALVGGRQLSDFLFEMRDDALTLQAQVLSGRIRRGTFAATIEVAPYLVCEGACVDRLLQKAVATDRQARITVALSRDGDDRHAAQLRLGAQAQRH